MLFNIHIGCNDVFSPQCVSKWDFSEKQVDWLSSCTVCIFEAFSQSGFFCGHESMRKSIRAKYAANKFLNFERFREVVNSHHEFPEAAEAPCRRRHEVRQEQGALDLKHSMSLT